MENFYRARLETKNTTISTGGFKLFCDAVVYANYLIDTGALNHERVTSLLIEEYEKGE